MPGPQRVVLPLAVLLGLAALAGTPHTEAFKGTTYLMIRGADLEEPIVLHSRSGVERHAPTNTGHLARLYRSLLIGNWETPDSLSARHYEVAHFFVSMGAPPPMTSGAPVRPLVWEEATSISHIYPDLPGGPIWNPAYAPVPLYLTGMDPQWPPPQSHSRGSYRGLSAEARAVLEELGLSFRGDGMGSSPLPNHSPQPQSP